MNGVLVLSGLAIAGMAAYVGWRAGRADVVSRLDAQSEKALRDRLAAHAHDATLFLAIVSLCRERYVEEIRPKIVEWTEAFSEFDWGTLKAVLKEEHAPINVWLERWRSEDMARYEDQEHKFLSAFLELEAAVKTLEDKIDYEDHAEVMKSYRWGEVGLHDPLQTIRAYLVFFEPGPLEDLPDRSDAWHDAESPDEERASEHREAITKKIRDLAETLEQSEQSSSPIMDADTPALEVLEQKLRAVVEDGLADASPVADGETSELRNTLRDVQDELGRRREETERKKDAD